MPNFKYAAKDNSGRAMTGFFEAVDYAAAVDMLRKQGLIIVSVKESGKTKASARASILERFRSGELQVVLSSQLADEGLDVPRLDRLVLAAPSKARGRTVQRLGRIMRCHPGKVAPVLFDLVDSAVGPLRWQAVQRQRAYAELLGVQPEARKAAHG